MNAFKCSLRKVQAFCVCSQKGSLMYSSLKLKLLLCNMARELCPKQLIIVRLTEHASHIRLNLGQVNFLARKHVPAVLGFCQVTELCVAVNNNHL